MNTSSLPTTYLPRRMLLWSKHLTFNEEGRERERVNIKTGKMRLHNSKSLHNSLFCVSNSNSDFRLLPICRHNNVKVVAMAKPRGRRNIYSEERNLYWIIIFILISFVFLSRCKRQRIKISNCLRLTFSRATSLMSSAWTEWTLYRTITIDMMWRHLTLCRSSILIET